MRHIFSAVVTAIEAAAIALASLVAMVVCAVLLGIVTFQLSVPVETLAQVTAGVWSLSHGVAFSLSLDEMAAFSLGLAPETIAIELSLIPLGFSIITAVLAWRLGTRLPGRVSSALVSLCAGTLGFAGAATGILFIAQPFVAEPLWRAALTASGWFVIPALLGLIVTQRERFAEVWFRLKVRAEQAGFPKLGWSFEPLVPRAFRLALALLSGLTLIAALGFTIALLFGYARVMSLSQSLQLDTVGAIMIALVQFVYLPTMLLWALSWLAGPGFALGAGSVVSPFETLLGPLPMVPVFGAVPESLGQWGLLAPVTVVLTSLVVGLLLGARPEMRNPPLWRTLIVCVMAVLLAGLVVWAGLALAGGSLGPERLSVAGPDSFITALWLSVQMLVGVMGGVALRRLSKKSTPQANEAPHGDVWIPMPTSTSEEPATHAEPNDTPTGERIADPLSEPRPWFHSAAKAATSPQETHDFSEEALLRQYAWDSDFSSSSEADGNDLDTPGHAPDGAPSDSR